MFFGYGVFFYKKHSTVFFICDTMFFDHSVIVKKNILQCFLGEQKHLAHRLGHMFLPTKKEYCTVFFGGKNQCDREKKTLYTTEVFADVSLP